MKIEQKYITTKGK